MEFSPRIMDRLQDKGDIDVVIGIQTKNVESTILHVMNVVYEGVTRYLSSYRTLVVVSDGFSTDRTTELAEMFDISPVNKIVIEQMGDPGKGNGMRTVIDIAHELNAIAVGFVDGDLLSIKAEWVQELVRPIVYGRTDLVVPFYVRDKFDGLITNNLAYPFTMAYYGTDVRQPIGGEFCISRRLMESLRQHPLFPADFGIDIFITSVAAAENRRIREAMLGLKLHESTTKYVEPEASIIPMFRNVVRTMFDLAIYYADKSESMRHRENSFPDVSDYFGPTPVPVKVDRDKMFSTVVERYAEYEEIYNKLLPAELVNSIVGFVEDNKAMDAETWACCVWHIFNEYSREKDIMLIDALRVIWFARFVSFYDECKNMDLLEAENRIKANALVFNDKMKDILKTN